MFEGTTHGWLTAIELDHRDGTGCQMWLFSCKCGNKVIRYKSAVTCGHVRSCGCLHKVMATLRSTKHGMARHPAYYAWQAARQRCNNPNNPRYKCYGKRGITFHK